MPEEIVDDSYDSVVGAGGLIVGLSCRDIILGEILFQGLISTKAGSSSCVVSCNAKGVFTEYHKLCRAC